VRQLEVCGAFRWIVRLRHCIQRDRSAVAERVTHSFRAGRPNSSTGHCDAPLDAPPRLTLFAEVDKHSLNSA
jgi:hypothetical protein